MENNSEKIRVKIFSVKKEKVEHENSIGIIIIENKQIKVAVKRGFIIIEELQLPNKRRMTAKELLNGYIFHKNAKML